MQRKCLRCHLFSSYYDWCIRCISKQEQKDNRAPMYDHFRQNLQGVIHTVYIMTYKKNNQNKLKIGYSRDLLSRVFEIKQDYPENVLIYLREFMTESESRRYEIWLKGRTRRELHKIITGFKTKIKLFDN